MDKTNIMAEFIITGDHFEPKIITEQITIELSGTYIKGEKIDDKDLYIEKKPVGSWIRTIRNLMISISN